MDNFSKKPASSYSIQGKKTQKNKEARKQTNQPIKPKWSRGRLPH